MSSSTCTAPESRRPSHEHRIGAGTGLFTKALFKHPDFSGAIRELRAVEPSAGMRDVFVKTVQDERASAREGTFDTTNIEDGWADLVTIAQAGRLFPVESFSLHLSRHFIGARTLTLPPSSSPGSSSQGVLSPSFGTSKIGAFLTSVLRVPCISNARSR